MYKKSIKYACAPKAWKRPTLSKIYFDRKASRYIATNGHILLVELTNDKEPAGDACAVNDINEILGVDRLLQETDSNTELLTVPTPAEDEKIIKLDNKKGLCAQYVGIIRRFAGKDCKFYYKPDAEEFYKPFTFKSADGLRFGLIMPIALGVIG